MDNMKNIAIRKLQNNFSLFRSAKKRDLKMKIISMTPIIASIII